MAKLWGISPAFTVETFKEHLSLDEQKFVLKNFTEFSSPMKSSMKLNPEEYLRGIYNGSVNVSGNCPIRTIFHEWATRVVNDPESVDVCQSAARMELTFKQFHPNPASPFHNRSFDFMMNEDCYDINSYRILDGNMEEYLAKYIGLPFYSDAEKKSVLIYATKFMFEKTKQIAAVNWIWLKLNPYIKGYKNVGLGYDVEKVYHQEEARTVENFNKVLKIFTDKCLNMLANPGIIECRQYAALICFAEYKGFKSKRIRDLVKYAHGTGTYEEVLGWCEQLTSTDALTEFSDMKKEFLQV